MMDSSSKEEILDRIEETAYNYERDYHGCSQSAFLAIQDHLKVGDEATFRSASALCAGIALMGDSCGALVAGIMALGLVYGRQHIESFEELQSSMTSARKLYRSFQSEFGSCMCRDIMKSRLGRSYDLASETEYEQFKEAGGYRECPKVVARAARLAAELILAEKQ